MSNPLDGETPGAARTEAREGEPLASASGRRIWVDADACPVKDEVERLAARRGLEVVHVCALSGMDRRDAPAGVQIVRVAHGPDAADEWILERCRPGDLLITLDVPLAAAAVARGALALDFRGRVFDEANVGHRRAVRDLLMRLRDQGARFRGPRSFSRRDRQTFTAALARLLDRFAAEPSPAAALEKDL